VNLCNECARAVYGGYRLLLYSSQAELQAYLYVEERNSELEPINISINLEDYPFLIEALDDAKYPIATHPTEWNLLTKDEARDLIELFDLKVKYQANETVRWNAVFDETNFAFRLIFTKNPPLID
jgi:hypothetical protein